MTPLSRITFAALLVATFAAFFVTARIKRSAPVVLGVRFAPLAFSPVLPGADGRTTLSFSLKRSDDATVVVIGPDGDVVRTLLDGRALAARRRVRLVWNGRDDAGRRLPDAYYQVHVGLRREGRTVVLPGAWRLDTLAPRPRLLRVGGRNPRRATAPLIVAAGRPRRLLVRFSHAPSKGSALVVERTSQPAPEVVALSHAHRGPRVLVWDGTVDGRPAPPGVYRLRVQTRDEAGNVGLTRGRLRGTGVTVRGVAVQAPLVPVRRGSRVVAFVDARGARWRWTLRPIGVRRPGAAGRGRGVRLAFSAPRTGGLYALTVTARGYRAHAPLVVARRPTARLVVLPALTWQGTLVGDDDGDGVPNTLPAGEPAGLVRPRTALPPGWDETAALLARLEAPGHGPPPEITTDLALLARRRPTLAGHRGVVLVGAASWEVPAVGGMLRAWVHRGGRLLLVDPLTLRRDVRVAAGALRDPGPLTPRDALGTTLGPLVHRRADLTVFRDRADLFVGTGGLFAGWPAYEAVRAPRPGGLLSVAGPNPATPVISAQALGRGRILRAGLPGLTSRLSDPDVGALVDQAWSLLSR